MVGSTVPLTRPGSSLRESSLLVPATHQLTLAENHSLTGTVQFLISQEHYACHLISSSVCCNLRVFGKYTDPGVIILPAHATCKEGDKNAWHWTCHNIFLPQDAGSVYYVLPVAEVLMYSVPAVGFWSSTCQLLTLLALRPKTVALVIVRSAGVYTKLLVNLLIPLIQMQCSCYIWGFGAGEMHQMFAGVNWGKTLGQPFSFLANCELAQAASKLSFCRNRKLGMALQVLVPFCSICASYAQTFVFSSARFLRHVPVVYVDYPGEVSLKQIYGTFNRAMLRLVPSLKPYADPLTNAMVEFYMMSQVRGTLGVDPG